jgi:hypothetical protein
MEMSGQLHAPAALPGVIALYIHYVGGWVVTTASLDVVEKRKFT